MATDLTSLTATVQAIVRWTAQKGVDMSTPADAATLAIKESITFGTGNNASDMIWHDRRLIVAAATDTLDLAGSLTNVWGVTVTFTKIHAILVHNRSDETLTEAVEGVAHTANAAIIEVTTSAANGFLLFKTAADAKILAAGDWMVAYSKAGMAVTAATGDLLDIIETATLEAAYDIVLIGESA